MNLTRISTKLSEIFDQESRIERTSQGGDIAEGRGDTIHGEERVRNDERTPRTRPMVSKERLQVV